MVTLTGSSPGGGACAVVRGEDARGKAMVGPEKEKHQGSFPQNYNLLMMKNNVSL